jgi:hypothetical protein
MPRCEDFPCCGHAFGDCPDASGRMTCVECGRRLPRNAASSICAKCQLRRKQMSEDDLDRDYSMNY